jgi:hypothetical protein
VTTADAQLRRLTEQVSQLTRTAEEDRLARWRAEVAADKKLTAAQARRLTGTTKEELESDADDLLEAFGGRGGSDGGADGDKKNEGGNTGASGGLRDLADAIPPLSTVTRAPIADPDSLADLIPRF